MVKQVKAIVQGCLKCESNEIIWWEDYRWEVVQQILLSLTNKFGSKVVAIEESNYINQLSITKLMGSSQAYEERMSKNMKNSIEGAFQAKIYFQKKRCSLLVHSTVN